MSLHQAFSENLTRLCRSKSSIASVCRGTRINRQQFGRYLSGRALPQKNNLKKICRYFKVTEADLFQRPQARGESGILGEMAPAAYEEVRAALKLLYSQPPPSIVPGLYFAHFADPNDPKVMMRSTVVVRADGRLLTFRRLTAFLEPKKSWWSHFTSDHQGIVLERRHWIYFLGLNGIADLEPTLLALHYLPNAEPMLGGHAALLTPGGPTITAAVVTRCEAGTGLRAALRASHAYSIDDPTIDPIITEALESECRKLIATTRKLDLSVEPQVELPIHQL